MISCSGVIKRFGALTAVNDVSFAFGPGEICALLGPNGAGKSTLVRMLAGLLVADAGEIRIAGVSGREETRRLIGVVPDDMALLPELTIEEQLAMCGRIYGLDRGATRRRTEELLRLFSLWEMRRTYARECSYGMRKKTALAMALLHAPPVLILDEPFEGVDPASSESIGAMLRAAADSGVTVLVTTHILSLVTRICDRVMVIRDGRLVWNSLVAELPGGVERLYFEQVEPPVVGKLEWLRSQRS